MDAADDPVFLGNYNRVLSNFDTYHGEPLRAMAPSGCARPIWWPTSAPSSVSTKAFQSTPGGLGILAGDHCKAASDMRLPFIGVGLLYRQGYFYQTIDGEGNQHAPYTDSDFEDLPVTPRAARDGSDVQRQGRAAGPARDVKVWQAK